MRKFAIIATTLALLALLGYSLERSAWLFGLFERWTILAYAAAIVVELAAVALIVGAGALAGIDPSARAWANRALLAVLSVQALANLSAGYLRGGQSTLALFGAHSSAAYVVAAVLWLVTNLAVPGLVLCLSKLLERLLIVQAPLDQPTITVSAPERPALPVGGSKLLEQKEQRSSAATERPRLAGLHYYNDAGMPRWPCPKCGSALASARAIGAAKTNKGCKDCRGKAT